MNIDNYQSTNNQSISRYGMAYDDSLVSTIAQGVGFVFGNGGAGVPPMRCVGES
jgi:hypothetical protein